MCPSPREERPLLSAPYTGGFSTGIRELSPDRELTSHSTLDVHREPPPVGYGFGPQQHYLDVGTLLSYSTPMSVFVLRWPLCLFGLQAIAAVERLRSSWCHRGWIERAPRCTCYIMIWLACPTPGPAMRLACVLGFAI